MVQRRRSRPRKEINESWLYNYWRPAIAWQYFVVCLFDFIIAPLLFAWLSHHTGAPYVQWDPLTLKESGFYHMSMGAIIGVAAWTRGQEKIKRVVLGYEDYGPYDDNRYSEFDYENDQYSQIPLEEPLMRRDDDERRIRQQDRNRTSKERPGNSNEPV
jgi:hypothetical protein